MIRPSLQRPLCFLISFVLGDAGFIVACRDFHSRFTKPSCTGIISSESRNSDLLTDINLEAMMLPNCVQVVRLNFKERLKGPGAVSMNCEHLSTVTLWVN